MAFSLDEITTRAMVGSNLPVSAVLLVNQNPSPYVGLRSRKAGLPDGTINRHLDFTVSVIETMGDGARFCTQSSCGG
jgi:hypothetical protein